MRAVIFTTRGNGFPACLTHHNGHVGQAQTVHVISNGCEIALSRSNCGVHHGGSANIGCFVRLLPIPFGGIVNRVSQWVGVHGHKINGIQNGFGVLVASCFCKEGPVVIGGHRLRHLIANGVDVLHHVGHRHSIERPIDHGFIANAQRDNRAFVIVGQSHCTRYFGIVDCG